MERFKGETMRILVYGAGVLGSNLASNLCKAKKDVTILARGKWAENIKKNGLKVKNKMGFRTKTCRMPVMTSLEPDDIYSVIFVALRYTQLDDIIHILRSNGTKNIVFVGNNVRARYYRDQRDMIGSAYITTLLIDAFIIIISILYYFITLRIKLMAIDRSERVQ